MKRLVIALSTIGLSATIFAALPATTDPTLVAVPQLPGGFVIGATAAYLQPSFTHGDLDYAVSASVVSPFFSHSEAAEPGYDWGWGINVGYIFPNTGNDVNLSYFHIDTRDNNFSPNALPLGNSFITADLIAAIAIIVNNFQAFVRTEYDLNRVDLTAGQFIDVGGRLILHPSVGMSYLNLERQLNSFYRGSATGIFSISLETLTDSTTIHEKSDFNGVGPLANLDASYYLGLGFGLVAHADAGIYLGDIDARTDAVRALSGTVFATIPRTFTALINNSLRSDSTSRLVPVTDIKLGADYTYLFNNAANSDLTLEVGYQVSHYFNAVDRLNSSLSNAFVNNPGTAFSPITAPFINRRTTSDVSFDGPYVNLSWHI